MKTANIFSLENEEKKALSKIKKRDAKKKVKMKVTGAGVKQVLRIKKQK